jgi:hypothetical protein
MFYVWSGYAALSTFIGRNVHLQLGRMVYYPNIYTMLVGSAGSGKTQAMDIAKRLIEDVPDMAVRISMSTETCEGWLRYLAGDPSANPPIESQVMTPVIWPGGANGSSYPMLIKANEFINFIAMNPVGWINLLNDIYDQDFFGYRTKNMGQDRIVGPCIIVLGGLPTETSAELQKANIIASGFARRTIFQYGERKFHEPHAIIHYDSVKEEIRRTLIEYGTAVTKVHGAFKCSPDTEKWFTEWYDGNSALIPAAESHMVNWLNSKPAQLIKIGMLTSLSESFDLELRIEHMQRALNYFEILEKDLYKIFGGIGRNELAQIAIKIKDFIAAHPQPLTERNVRRKFFSELKAPYDYNAIRQYLVDTGEIVCFSYTKGIGLDQTRCDVLGTNESMEWLKTTLAQGGSWPYP